MHLTTAILTVLLLATQVEGLTPTSTTAKEIFHSIVEKAETRSTRFVFEQSTQMMGMTINGSGEGTYDLPRSRTDLKFVTPIGEIAVRTISNGKTMWQVEETPVGKKAARYDMTESMDAGGPVDPFMAFAGIKTQEFLDALLEQFDASVAGIDRLNDVEVYVVDMAPKVTGKTPSMQFRIGVDDAFPRQMQVFAETGEPITTMTVTELEFGITADDAVFAYVPGNDVEVVEPTAAPPMPTGGTGLEGSVAPDFTLTSLDGKEIALSSLRGSYVLIDFWASWCPPCKRALPYIQELSETAKGLFVLTVNAEPPNVARQYMERAGFTFTTLVDADRSVSAAYAVRSIPTTFIIAPDGTIARQIVGYHSAPQMNQALAEAGYNLQ